MAEKIKLDTKYDLRGNYDPSSSEDEYSPNEKRLLAKVRNRNDSDEDEEEEVLGFSNSDSDEERSEDGEDDFADSDVEGQEGSEDDLPDPKAWGQKKKLFYNTDYVDADYGGFGKDEEAATLEEREAKALQKRLTEQLGDEDFSLEYFSKKADDKEKADEEAQVVIKSDLTQLSKRQKLQLLKKESPELLGLIDDFKEKMNIAKDTLRPILELSQQKILPSCSAVHLVKTYYETILNYCTNISFYIMLKAKRVTIQNHPVIKRLIQYREVLKQIESLYSKSTQAQLEKILSAFDNGEKISSIEPSAPGKRTLKQTKLNRKKLKLLNGSSKMCNGIEDDADEPEESGEEGPSAPPDIENEFGVDSENGKRAITYQMAKNKGLTPKRKKEQRNPRVKHRNKYRKAKIRRKGAIRDVRTEVNRYDGEMSGIKSNVKKSIKIR